MKYSTMIMMLFAAIVSITTFRITGNAQASTVKLYQQMTAEEKSEFISREARRIARQMSGSEYEFTPAFESYIQQAVDKYAKRIGNGNGENSQRDTRLIFARAQAHAPTVIAAFKARNVSPLIGLYIPWIESAYVNIESPNSMGSMGMFQFLPKTGERYGLTRQDLLDVGKSADAAARYIGDNIETFKGDPMKEALALLAYNRGGQKLRRDVRLLVNDQNKQCSICALTAGVGQLDATFQNESIYYVPLFFAAAILGENPHLFGLQLQPLSSHTVSN